MSVSTSAYYYKPKKRLGDQAIEDCLHSLAAAHPRWGFDKMMLKIKNDEQPWNHKRVKRIYCELGLNIRIKPRKRLAKGEARVLMQPLKPNLCWSIDFMTDTLACGQKFRTLNVLDDYNRECLLIEPSISLPARRVVQLLARVINEKGRPEMIRVDNGPEFISSTFRAWAAKKNILLHFIQPGKPAQNGFVERFNRSFREEILDMTLFNTLSEARACSKSWMKIYNNERPHESLAGLAPIEFALRRSNKTLSKKRGGFYF